MGFSCSPRPESVPTAQKERAERIEQLFGPAGSLKHKRQHLDSCGHCSLWVRGSGGWSMAKAPLFHDFFLCSFSHLPCQSEKKKNEKEKEKKELLSLSLHLPRDCCRHGGSDCKTPFVLTQPSPVLQVPCRCSPVREAERKTLFWNKWKLLMSALV